MIVMMIAMTPSLNASSRPLPMQPPRVAPRPPLTCEGFSHRTSASASSVKGAVFGAMSTMARTRGSRTPDPHAHTEDGRCGRGIAKSSRKQLACGRVLNVDLAISDIRRRRGLGRESDAEQHTERHEADQVLEDGTKPHTFARLVLRVT